MMSGDTSFESATEISSQHEIAYAEAYLKGSEPPTLSFDVDDILEGERNSWLPDMHITAEMDYSMFADNIRKCRDSAGASLKSLARIVGQKQT